MSFRYVNKIRLEMTFRYVNKIRLGDDFRYVNKIRLGDDFRYVNKIRLGDVFQLRKQNSTWRCLLDTSTKFDLEMSFRPVNKIRL